MMFELMDNKIFKECFKSISRIIDEAIIECDNEGIRLKALDRGHVTFVGLSLKRDVFDVYVCDEPVKISVDTYDLNNILRRCKNNDVLKLYCDEDNLIIVFDGDSRRTFKLRLIGLDYETPNPPMLDLPVRIELPFNVLNDALGDVELYSDKVRFVVDENCLSIMGDDEYGECEVKYIHGVNVNGVVESVFSMEKIVDMLKSNVSDNIILNLGNDTPFILSLPISEGSGLTFLLAPRLEED